MITELAHRLTVINFNALIYTKIKFSFLFMIITIKMKGESYEKFCFVIGWEVGRFGLDRTFWNNKMVNRTWLKDAENGYLGQN